MPWREFPKNKRETVRVTPNQYEGHDLIDIRVYARHPETKEPVATKKGISLNVDTIPELIEVLLWALGQPCDSDSAAPSRHLEQSDAERLAEAAWKELNQHGTAVHWDSAEKMILSRIKGFTKWDLHYILASRRDLFDRVENGCFRARKRQP